MLTMMIRIAAKVFVVVACFVLCTTLVGCMDGTRMAEMRDSAVLTREQLAIEANRLAAIANDPEHPQALRHANATAAAQLRSHIATMDTTIEQLDHWLAGEQTPDAMIQVLTNTTLPFLPAPLQAPVLLLTATGFALVRAAQLKKAAGSIAEGIAKAAQKDQEFRSVFARHADTFRSVQTPSAKRIVDEKVRNNFMLRLPI